MPPSALLRWLIVESTSTLPPKMTTPKYEEMLDACEPGVSASTMTPGANPEYVALRLTTMPRSDWFDVYPDTTLYSSTRPVFE